MKQNEENSQKAQKLTKEELEQVNGGVTAEEFWKGIKNGGRPRTPFPGQDPNRTPWKKH